MQKETVNRNIFLGGVVLVLLIGAYALFGPRVTRFVQQRSGQESETVFSDPNDEYHNLALAIESRVTYYGQPVDVVDVFLHDTQIGISLANVVAPDDSPREEQGKEINRMMQDIVRIVVQEAPVKRLYVVIALIRPGPALVVADNAQGFEKMEAYAAYFAIGFQTTFIESWLNEKTPWELVVGMAQINTTVTMLHNEEALKWLGVGT